MKIRLRTDIPLSDRLTKHKGTIHEIEMMGDELTIKTPAGINILLLDEEFEALPEQLELWNED